MADESAIIPVLYVDDEPELLELGRLFLERESPLRVTTTGSGPSALELLADTRFDAIIADYQMPEMNGITLLKEIRKSSGIPFILFTGKGREEVVIEAINSGADFYLQKGGDPEAQFAELIHKVLQAVSRHKTLQALHDSEALYRTVFEATGTGMMILDEDTTIAVANRELERISGYSREEIEGKIPWTQFVSPGDLERMKQYHRQRRIDPASVPKNYEFTFLARNGERIATYITVEMIPGTKKSVVSLIDISKEKKVQAELADSEEMFRSLTESLAEGIYMIQDNHFIYVNPAFCALFGHPAGYILGLPDVTLLFADNERARIHERISARVAGVRSEDQYRVRALHADGSEFSVEIHGTLTRYRGTAAIIGTVTRTG